MPAAVALPLAPRALAAEPRPLDPPPIPARIRAQELPLVGDRPQGVARIRAEARTRAAVRTRAEAQIRVMERLRVAAAIQAAA